MRLRLTLASCLALAAMGAPANAALITGLVNTGINVNGSNQDLSYALTSSPGSTYTNAFKLTVSGFPFPSWLANTGTSNWIVPGSPTTTNHVQGIYVYQLQFNVDASTNLSSIVIGGRWATDNTGTFRVNGGPSLTGFASAGFGSWTNFSLNSSNGFVLGSNTITYTVTNAAGSTGNPTGLRVEFTSVAASAVPEPSTFAAAAVAIGGAALARVRRRRTA